MTEIEQILQDLLGWLIAWLLVFFGLGCAIDLEGMGQVYVEQSSRFAIGHTSASGGESHSAINLLPEAWEWVNKDDEGAEPQTETEVQVNYVETQVDSDGNDSLKSPAIVSEGGGSVDVPLEPADDDESGPETDE